MIKSKKLTSKSGLTIPKDLRAEVGFRPGDAVDIVPDGARGIRITLHRPTCRLCGNAEQVSMACGLHICRECAIKLREELTRQYGQPQN